MFQKILQWLRDRIDKMLNTGNLKQALKLDIAVSQPMANALAIWSAMYENKSSWLSNEIKSLNLASAISAEIARAVTIEMDVSISGSKRADYLTEQTGIVTDKLRTQVEYACALGGMVFKPYIEGENIRVDFVKADSFFPVSFDSSGNMTSCVFADQKTIGKDFYTRLEYHAMTPEGYRITNSAFKSSVREMLGSPVSLSTVDAWTELEPEATIINIDRPLFAYFKMPFANNIDPTSPLGVSVYSRAVGLLEQADRLYSDLVWEFESGKRALYTDPLAFAKDSTGKPLLPDKRFYRLLDLNSKIDGKGFFEDWSPTIREVNILNGLDAILKRIEFTCGLAQGTISDPETVALTATEIKMARQRTYATITDTQKSLEDALEQLIYAMDVWATIGNLASAGAYVTNYEFDDSVVSDHDAQFTQDTQAVTLGTMSKIEWRMRQYGESLEIAQEMLELVKKEQVDRLANRINTVRQ